MLRRSDVMDYDELRITIEAGPTGPPKVSMEYVSDGRSEAVEYFLDFDFRRDKELIWQTRAIVAPSRLVRSVSGGAIDRVERMGRELFGRLFGNEGQIFFMRAREEALARQRGLRLRLDTSNPTVALVPWEFLHDGRDFINLSSSSPLVRRNTLGYQRGNEA